MQHSLALSWLLFVFVFILCDGKGFVIINDLGNQVANNDHVCCQTTLQNVVCEC